MHLTGMMSCLNFRFIGTFFHHTICPFESISFEFDRNHHHGPKAGKFGYYKLWSIPVVTMPYVTKVMSQGLSLVGYSLPGNFMNSQFHLQHFVFAQVPEVKPVHKAQRSVTKSKMDEVTCLRMYVCMYALFKILSWRHSQRKRLNVTNVTFYSSHHDQTWQRQPHTSIFRVNKV